MGTKNTIDMLNGPLARPMLMFALPLIASGVLQQSFNSVDVAVVGRFAGSDALAAVGSNGPVIGLLINMFLGLSVGVNVVIANYIGQRNSRGVRAAVSAAAVMAVLSGVIMLVTSQIVARPLLTALDTPASCLDQAVEYLRIYSVGMPFMIIYNFGSAILRSVGDTRRPFYCLVASGIVNVVLNLIFVIGFGMGVAGVAWATVFANLANAVIVVYLLAREQGDIRLDLRSITPDMHQMSKIIRVGFPAGLQSTVFSISNVFILSSINSFGSAAAAGSAAAINYEMYCYFVINAFAQTAVAFISQNYGAGQLDRCRRALRISLVYSVSTSIFLNCLITFNSGLFLSPFTTDLEVLYFAAERVTTALLFQWVACYYEMAGSAMRGLGYSMTPAIITIFGTCVLRLFWVGFFPADGSFAALLAVYPVSWLLTDVAMMAALARIRRRLPRTAEASEAASPTAAANA